MNRKLQVVVEGEYSDLSSVDSGVLQGTVLGPNCVKSKVRLFADDCLLYNSVKTILDQIQLTKDLKS